MNKYKKYILILSEYSLGQRHFLKILAYFSDVFKLSKDPKIVTDFISLLAHVLSENRLLNLHLIIVIKDLLDSKI